MSKEAKHISNNTLFYCLFDVRKTLLNIREEV